LADKASIHVTLLSRIENGKANVTIENIFKIASVLNITLGDLFRFHVK
jgi:transcriptional regulator with XRE-family HTH domain